LQARAYRKFENTLPAYVHFTTLFGTLPYGKNEMLQLLTQCLSSNWFPNPSPHITQVRVARKADAFNSEAVCVGILWVRARRA
jgi:hypothetical protein